MYPLENHHEGASQGASQGQNKKKKSQKKGQHDKNQNNSKTVKDERHKVGQGQPEVKPLSTKERESILRKSIEDLAKFQNEALTIQGTEQFYGAQGEGQTEHLQGQGHQFQGHHQWHANSNQNAPERPYDETNPAHQHQHAQMQGQGHYYPEFQGQGQNHATQEHMHQAYDQQFAGPHQHFRNIYEGRPYHTIGEREETEGGNAGQENNQYYQYHDNYGYHQNSATPYVDSTDRGFYSHSAGFADGQHIPSHNAPNGYHQGHPNVQNQMENQSHPNENQTINRTVQNEARKDSVNDQILKEPMSPRKSREGFPEGYKVNYHKGPDDKEKGARKDQKEEKKQSNESKEDLEGRFMQQGLYLKSR